MRFGHLEVVPSLIEESVPLSRVIFWDGDSFVAPPDHGFHDDIDAELARLPGPHIWDSSPVKSRHCAVHWSEQTEFGDLPWVCTRTPRHSGDHQACGLDDTVKAIRPKRPRTPPLAEPPVLPPELVA